MAHTCPNCYAYCTCNGDWDDINFVGDDPECMHCEDDLFPDDDDDAEQSVERMATPSQAGGSGLS